MRACAVFSCRNEGVHTFPTDETVKQQWIKATRINIKRKIGWHLRKFSCICSEHFVANDFEIRRGRRMLKSIAVPSIFPWTTTTCISSNVTCEVTIPQEQELIFNPTEALKTYSKSEPPVTFVEEYVCLNIDVPCSERDPLEIHQEIEEDTPVPEASDLEVIINNDDIKDANEKLSSSKCDKSAQTDQNLEPTSMDLDSPFSLCKYKNNDKAIHFYTGLESFEKVMFVFDTLGDCSNLMYFYEAPPKKLKTLEQFLITLIILRRHKEFEEIAMLYLISVKQVANIFITWIRFMALQWKNLDLWIDRETVRCYMPLDFNDKYPMTRVVIDATECPIKKPGLPLTQQITFSSYKNKNTVKFLIGIAPSGLITYISPCYGGSATDRQIIERSNILGRFDYSDEIMVDKGLNVQDIFISYGVKVNMPTFFKKGNQINPETLSRDRKVASKRVHIEQVIGMLKTYKILKQPMNQTETLLSSDIAFICAMLVNFRSNIINKDA